MLVTNGIASVDCVFIEDGRMRSSFLWPRVANTGLLPGHCVFCWVLSLLKSCLTLLLFVFHRFGRDGHPVLLLLLCSSLSHPSCCSFTALIVQVSKRVFPNTQDSSSSFEMLLNQCIMPHAYSRGSRLPFGETAERAAQVWSVHATPSRMFSMILPQH